MTPHNEAKKEDISDIVLMPGDPLRAKYIADNFMENTKVINTVRNMLGYTGYYKGKRITVFASGMGMPSIGIYAYELFKFYDVKSIIRIGSCGTYSPDLNIFDTILVDNSYTQGNFAHSLDGTDCHISKADEYLNDLIEKKAKEQNIQIIKGNVVCSEVFDYYVKDLNSFINSFPKELNIIGAEMESFALFYLANYFSRKAACLLTVVDSHYKHEEISAIERQNSLNTMIKLALDSSLEIK